MDADAVKSSPLPLWEFRLPVKALALSARRPFGPADFARRLDKVFVEIIDGVLLTNSGQKSVLVWWMGWEFWLSNVRLLKLVSLLSFFCGYFLAISGLFGLHHNGLFTFGLSDWTTRTIGLSQFVLKRLLDYSNWTYGSSGLSKFGLHSK